MQKIILSFFILLLAASCASNKKVNANNAMPECLQKKIIDMSEDPYEGTPLYVTQYQYKGKTVYYMAAPCCDKFNIVFDSDCNVLGYPDGGLNGKGDGSLQDFRQEATNSKVIWANKNTK